MPAARSVMFFATAYIMYALPEVACTYTAVISLVLSKNRANDICIHDPSPPGKSLYCHKRLLTAAISVTKPRAAVTITTPPPPQLFKLSCLSFLDLSASRL